jgi:hypothetical protein
VGRDHLGDGGVGGGASGLWQWGRSSSRAVAGNGVLPCGSVEGGPPGEERDRYGVQPANASQDGGRTER